MKVRGFTRAAVTGMALMAGIGAASLMPNGAHAGKVAGPVVREASGSDAASIQWAVDAFRADLGGNNNGVGGTFAGGRREINWDGVPDAFSSPNALPANFFNANSPRGVVFSTPGNGFQVSANASNPTGTAVRFGNIDSRYSNAFSVFSPQRLFTPTGSNDMEVWFFLPGTNSPATVRGFGAVFTDVDFWGSTSIEYFNAWGWSLGTLVVQPSQSGGLSFAGATFGDGPQNGVAYVRIHTGTRALGPGVIDDKGTDVVVMDDFIYGEPQAISAASFGGRQ